MLGLKQVAHAIASQPLVYDAIQIAAGVRQVDERLAARLGELPGEGLALDVGGGTGRLRAAIPAAWQYLCLDNELPKLRRFNQRQLKGWPVLGDATAMPFPDGSVDLVTCTLVSHHIASDDLEAFFGEFRRVLKPTGRIVFLDALLRPDRSVSRLLWHYDRGAHPRLAEDLSQMLARQFRCVDQELFTVWHQYLLWMGLPRS